MMYDDINTHTHTVSHVCASVCVSSEVLPSDGGQDGVDEVQECGQVGKHLKQT